MPAESLEFEDHLRNYELFIRGVNSENDRYFTAKAQKMHALVVSDALRDVFLASVSVSAELSSNEAVFFLQFGVARRLRMMWDAYRWIIFNISPNRKQPLSQELVNGATRDLNILYINIRGIIDNFAWALLHERGSSETKTKKGTAVNLFWNKFNSDPNFGSLKPEIDRLSDWFSEIKKKRDPAAHRIPLCVPPAILNPEQAEQYHEIYNAYVDATNQLRIEDAEEYLKVLERVGDFMPGFGHHPNEPFMPLYPTIPTDVAKLVQLSNSVFDFLRS